MKDALSLASLFISYFLREKQQPFAYGRLLVNLAAFLLLVCAYILGCKVVYSYLAHWWGETISLLALCILFFATSLILYGIGRFLKPKKSASSAGMPNFAKVINNISSHPEMVKKVCSAISAKMLVGVFAAAVMVSYLIKPGKKDII